MSCAGSEFRRTWGATLAIALFAVGAGGCRSLEMDPPPDFLELESENHEFKATTADDARLWARQFADYDLGDLAFWTAALRTDLIDNRGYSPVEDGAFEDATGRPGTWAIYDVTRDGERLRYLAALFVIERRPLLAPDYNSVRIAEFTAPTVVFDAHREAVMAALRTLRD